MLNRKGQNTAEYAILIALVIGAAIAMQTYVKRGFQGGAKFAVDKMRKTEASKTQYEPYYLEQSYHSKAGAYSDTEETKVGDEVTRVGDTHSVNREGYQQIANTTNAD